MPMVSNASTRDVAEQAKLVETEEEDISEQRVDHSAVRCNRRLVFGAGLSTALVAGVLWKAFAPCAQVIGMSKDSADSFVTLAEQLPEDSYDLLDGRSDEDAREEWLAAARTMGTAEAEEETEEAAARTRETVQAAMEVSDPVDAKKIVKRAMARALQNSMQKRRELKKRIKGPHHFLKGHRKQTTTSAPAAMFGHRGRESSKDDRSYKKSQSSKGLHSSNKDHSSKDDRSEKNGHSSKRPQLSNKDRSSKKEHHQKSSRSNNIGTTQNPLFKMMSGGFGTGGSKKERTTTTADPGNPMGEHNAQCVFDVLSITNSIAALASNINDAAKTCDHVPLEELFFSDRTAAAVHAKVCSVNVFAAIGGVVSIASTLSGAADSCAATLVPNVDAKCSQAAIGLITAIAQTGGAITLISAACREDGWYGDIPKDRYPHNVGSNELFERDYNHEHGDGAPSTGRLLAEAPDLINEQSTAAPPRQLLFGGGRGSTATQCATQIGSVMWNLAAAGLAINSAGNVNDPGCPPANLWGQTDPKTKGIIYEVSQGLCAVDIESAITSFLIVIATLELIAVNCVDTLNVKAICGAGIDGVLAGSSGMAQAATGVWLVCDTLQREPIKTLVSAVHGIDTQTGLVTNALTGNAGRRLAHVHDHVEDLKRRFATPEEAWMSIGYDLNNASAVFRKAGLPEPDLKKFASLVEEPETVEDGGAGLFGGQHTCSD